MNKKVGLIFIAGILFSLILVSSKIEIGTPTSSTEKTINLITPPISIYTILNTTIVNSSSYWGNYYYGDYNMPVIKSFAYNQTTGGDNRFLKLDQTVPQTVSSGKPIFAEGLSIASNKKIDMSTGGGYIILNDGSDNMLFTSSSDFTFTTAGLGRIFTDSQIYSTVSTGTAPFTISSTTLNTNLNADLLDGLHYTSLCLSNGTGLPSNVILNNTEAGYIINATKVNSPNITISEINANTYQNISFWNNVQFGAYTTTKSNALNFYFNNLLKASFYIDTYYRPIIRSYSGDILLQTDTTSTNVRVTNLADGVNMNFGADTGGTKQAQMDGSYNDLLLGWESTGITVGSQYCIKLRGYWANGTGVSGAAGNNFNYGKMCGWGINNLTNKNAGNATIEWYAPTWINSTLNVSGNTNFLQNASVKDVLSLIPRNGGNGAITCGATLNNSFAANGTGIYACGVTGVAVKIA